MPTTVGNIQKPVFVADTTTSGYFINYRGDVVPSSGTVGTVTSVATAGLATGGPITTTGTVTVTAAVQSDQETATSTSVAVVPGVQQFHPSAAKLWLNADTGGGIILSYNITSITDTGNGTITVTIATDFSSTTYPIIGDCRFSALVRVRSVQITSSVAVGSFLANCVDETANNADPENWFFAAFGDQ
jgi:hypothetical protein